MSGVIGHGTQVSDGFTAILVGGGILHPVQEGGDGSALYRGSGLAHEAIEPVGHDWCGLRQSAWTE